MAGAPGVDVNNPEGFTSLSNPPQPRVIAVPQIAGTVNIPLSVFPDFRSDGGIRGFGGARFVSVFDANSTEGISTADIPAITDAPIATQGIFQIANPDANKLYKMVVRLRSAAGDPNFRDFTVAYRVVGPLEVPLEFAVWADGDIPDITYNGVDFFWSVDATPTEIRLRNAAGGVPVSNLAAVAFPAAAKDFILTQLQNARDSFLVVDFYADGQTSEATRRQYYHFYFDGAVWQFVKYRHRDYPAFDSYSGSDLGIAQATIDVGGGIADLTFTNNSHTFGQKFESFIVAGKKGYIDLDPKLVITGGTIDISSIVDFGPLSYLQRIHHDDQYITIYAATEEKIIVREIPLFNSANQTLVVAGDELVDPLLLTVEMLRSKLVTWPWIEFPNLLSFLNVPTGAVGADPAGGKYPDLLNINLYDGTNPVAVATYTDEVDLWNNMVELQLPNQGLTIPVLDVRALLTATSTHYRITADVRTVGSAPGVAYSIEVWFPLNTNGEPVLFTRSDMVVTPYSVDFTFNEWGQLEISYLNASGNVGTDVEVTGDIATKVVGTNPGAVQVDTHDIRDIISREASYVDVKFNYDDAGTDRDIIFRVPTTVERTQLVGAVDIAPIISGNTITFPTGSLAAVDGPPKVVTLIGDAGTVVIPDAQENQVYFTAQFGDGGERLMADPLRTYLDVEFLSGAVTQRVRVPNSFWDLRASKQQLYSVASRGHGPTAGGLASLSHDFTIPKVKIDLGTSEVTFEDDLSGMAWNLQQWMVAFLGDPLRKRVFTGTIVAATPYNIGEVLVDATFGDHVLLVFKHANGHQKIFAAEITNTTFVTAKRMQLDGFV